MAKFLPKPEPEKNQPEENLSIYLTEEERNVIAWRIEVLVKQGFDTWHAGRLAAIGDLDWRQAAELKANGCTQALVYELLS